jgi:hypothetical protein
LALASRKPRRRPAGGTGDSGTISTHPGHDVLGFPSVGHGLADGSQSGPRGALDVPAQQDDRQPTT